MQAGSAGLTQNVPCLRHLQFNGAVAVSLIPFLKLVSCICSPNKDEYEGPKLHEKVE